jgi:transposase
MRDPTALYPRTVHGPQGGEGRKDCWLIGVDVGKRTLSVAQVCAITKDVRHTVTVENTESGVAELLVRFSPKEPWVLEPTGRYSTRVVRQARAAERTVLLARPQEAKAFLRSLQARAKTDRLDSKGLALYALAVPLPPYPLKPAIMETLDELLSARAGLARAIAQFRQQAQELPAAAEVLAAARAGLERQRAELDRRIAALTEREPELEAVQRLQQVPGIGPVTAAAVVSCLAAKQFDHPDAFVAYTGLDTRVRESGQLSSRRVLSKRGKAELRRLLYLCAQANLRVADSPFRAQYERELAKGLPRTAALCAVARKLARLCWSLHRHGTTYHPDRVHQQPSSYTARWS